MHDTFNSQNLNNTNSYLIKDISDSDDDEPNIINTSRYFDNNTLFKNEQFIVSDFHPLSLNCQI